MISYEINPSSNSDILSTFIFFINPKMSIKSLAKLTKIILGVLI